MKCAYISPNGWLIGDTIFWATAWEFVGKPVEVIEEKEVDGVEIAICCLVNTDVTFEVPLRHLREV